MELKDKLENYISNNSSSEIQEGDIDSIYANIAGLRYVNEEFCLNTESFLNNLVNTEDNHELAYIPVDPIELRLYLKGELPEKEILYSFDFAKKYLVDYPILLGYNANRRSFGSVSILDETDGCFPQRLYLREEYLNTDIQDTVNRIILEEKVKIDFNFISDVKGVSTKAIIAYNAKKNNMKYAQYDGNIKLTDVERNIFSLLLDVKNYYPQLSNVELRVAGGWCKDKLMGQYSDDIDIAVSYISGLDFVQYVKEYTESNNISNVGKIYSTSLDKTQQLESAGLNVAAIELFGQKVEFVNLRTETYNEESRVPQQTVTNDPAEDAKRRDLSINALYYNIETGKIEDYVNALQDFEKKPDGTLYPKVIRTPVVGDDQDQVNQIYKDDPLRLLRALRFMSRYDGVQLHPSVINAMKNEDVLSLYDKLAPERASKEIRKMMEGDNAVGATEVLLNTGLYKKVFKIPENWHDIDMDQQSPFHNLTLKDHTLGVMRNFQNIADVANMPKNEKAMMMISTLLHDFGKMHPDIRKKKIDKKTGEPVFFDRDGNQVERRTYVGHEFESANFAKNIMTQMGFEPHEKKFVEIITKNHMNPHDFAKGMKPKHMGRFLNEVGDLWQRVMEHAHADALSKDQDQDKINEINEQRKQHMEQLRSYYDEMGGMINKPLIDGNKVQEIAKNVAPDFANSKKPFINVKGKNQHYMSLVNEKLLEQQWMKNVVTPEQAEKFTEGYIKQIAGMWRKEQENINKQADASSGSSPDGFLPTEGEWGEMQGITHLKRYIVTPFEVGSRVRFNPGGSSMSLYAEPIEGKVISKKDGRMVVKWDSGKYKGKHKGFDLTDTITMSRLEVLN